MKNNVDVILSGSRQLSGEAEGSPKICSQAIKGLLIRWYANLVAGDSSTTLGMTLHFSQRQYPSKTRHGMVSGMSETNVARQPPENGWLPNEGYLLGTKRT